MGIATVLGTTFGGAIVEVGAFIAVIAGIIAIVVGVYDIFKGKFEGIGLVMAGVGAILLLFIGWWALIPIAVGLAVYWVIKHWETVKEWFTKFATWLGSLFKGIWEGIRGF